MEDKWTMDTSEKVKIVLAICSLTVVAIIGGCSAVNNLVGMQDDNEIEEIIEQVVEGYTGLDLDLSPGSSER